MSLNQRPGIESGLKRDWLDELEYQAKRAEQVINEQEQNALLNQPQGSKAFEIGLRSLGSLYIQSFTPQEIQAQRLKNFCEKFRANICNVKTRETRAYAL